MTETTVQGDACWNCGIKTRDEAEYCYNCGSKIEQSGEVLNQMSELPGSSDVDFLASPPGETSADRIPMPDISLESAAVPVSKPMRTASSLRRDRTRHLAKTKEVVWVEREGPGLSFIVSSMIVVIITVIILIGAMYLK